jgi:large subunit ribosomal protein L30
MAKQKKERGGADSVPGTMSGGLGRVSESRETRPADSKRDSDALGGPESPPSSRGAADSLRRTVMIRMIGSVIGCPEGQRAAVRGLGLRKLNQVVEREDTPMVRGMIRKVPHLVAVVE